MRSEVDYGAGLCCLVVYLFVFGCSECYPLYSIGLSVLVLCQFNGWLYIRLCIFFFVTHIIISFN